MGTETGTSVVQATHGSTRTDKAVLEVSNLRVRFLQRTREVHAVNGLSYSVDRGKILAIIGESGSGKTVSARAVMGLLPPSAQISGSARLDGEELIGLSERELRRHRGPDVAMVFQDPARSLNPTMRVGQLMTETIRTHEHVSRAAARARTIELFGRVRLAAPAQRFHEYPHQLSGGMRQRVMIALALACNPKLLIADEATTALDVTTQAQIMNLLMDLRRDFGMAIIMISHDLGLAASYADEVMVMYAGKAVEQAKTQELFTHMRMPYTKALLDAVPRLDRPTHNRLALIGGRPPDLSQPHAGCPFAPRCPSARDDCHTVAPDFEEHEDSHWWACRYPTGLDA